MKKWMLIGGLLILISGCKPKDPIREIQTSLPDNFKLTDSLQNTLVYSVDRNDEPIMKWQAKVRSVMKSSGLQQATQWTHLMQQQPDMKAGYIDAVKRGIILPSPDMISVEPDGQHFYNEDWAVSISLIGSDGRFTIRFGDRNHVNFDLASTLLATRRQMLDGSFICKEYVYLDPKINREKSVKSMKQVFINSYKLDFNPDGTFFSTLLVFSRDAASSGKWRLSEDGSKLSFSNYQGEQRIDGEEQLMFFSENKLVLRAQDKKDREFEVTMEKVSGTQ